MGGSGSNGAMACERETALSTLESKYGNFVKVGNADTLQSSECDFHIEVPGDIFDNGH